MNSFEIVAHRGVPDIYPENTIPAFERAIELGADAVELDVRLTSDQVPVVFHYFYLSNGTAASGTVFEYSFEQLRNIHVIAKNGKDQFQIPTLAEVLEAIGGKIDLEIEIKGPEPESAGIIAGVLSRYKPFWNTIEVTSYEPLLLREFQKECPHIPTGLLFPRSEEWMELDIVTYLAIQRSKLAVARAVHLHPTQLSGEVVEQVRKYGIEIHAWDVNDEKSLETIAELAIPKICTDRFQFAQSFRQSMRLAQSM